METFSRRGGRGCGCGVSQQHVPLISRIFEMSFAEGWGNDDALFLGPKLDPRDPGFLVRPDPLSCGYVRVRYVST